ncbi:MAG: hypothetical protein LBC78_01835 [Oscillospiraceae bacterium]|jgi:hypothetical protein|nr:hypothetical protein [Oscillospiraceae bacterium]
MFVGATLAAFIVAFIIALVKYHCKIAAYESACESKYDRLAAELQKEKADRAHMNELFDEKTANENALNKALARSQHIKLRTLSLFLAAIAESDAGAVKAAHNAYINQLRMMMEEDF